MKEAESRFRFTLTMIETLTSARRMTELTQLRKEYHKAGLLDGALAPCPFAQFQVWLAEAMSANLVEPYAMVLSTVSADLQPSGRVVLLRRCDETGFTFYTNYQSHKGSDLETNPKASATFYWAELERQVRVEGTVIKTTPADSDAYFVGRPRGSQIAASVSAQSILVPSRSYLEELHAKLEKALEGKDVPRPSHWGGYTLQPRAIEFWQGRPNRLHDRIVYRKSATGWQQERLAP